MDTQRQASPQMTRVAQLVRESGIAMLTTAEADGSLRSRPLATLQMDSDGSLWFFTSARSPKVGEIERHRKVGLSYSNPQEQDYVSISGVAELVHDREKMRQLWTPWIEPWFPKGLDDPDLALLKVTVEQAEYWDAPAGRMRRLAGLARAITQGDTGALGEHEKVVPPRPDA